MIKEITLKNLKILEFPNQYRSKWLKTIFHFHIHIIPRRKDDIDNPRGGIRGVIPDKQKY